jgi:isopentenyl-diphosphate delta-isomerase type 1
MEEFMDIVDESDNVIGRDTRKAVHDNHQIHRGIHIFVVNSSGGILVQKRSTKKDYYPGFLDISVGAQVQSGESYEAAAHRELVEELGISENLTHIFDYNAYSSRQREKRRVFLCRSDGPFKPDPEEVDAIFFKSTDEISRSATLQDYTEGFLKSFAAYQDYLGRAQQ